MAWRALTDAQWERIRPHLPREKRRPQGGRPTGGTVWATAEVIARSNVGIMEPTMSAFLAMPVTGDYSVQCEVLEKPVAEGSYSGDNNVKIGPQIRDDLTVLE